MVIDMNEAQVRTVEQVRQVLAETQELQFRAAQNDEERYGWVEAVLGRGTAGWGAPTKARYWPTCGVSAATAVPR